MKNNIGKLDRFLRIAIGGGLFLAFLQGSILGLLSIVALIVSGILMLTAVLGTCPIYSLLGFSTSDHQTK